MTLIKHLYYDWGKGRGKSQKTFVCNIHGKNKKSVPWFVTED